MDRSFLAAASLIPPSDRSLQRKQAAHFPPTNKQQPLCSNYDSKHHSALGQSLNLPLSERKLDKKIPSVFFRIFFIYLYSFYGILNESSLV